MPVTVAIITSANRSARIRALAARHPNMTPVDIAHLTGETPRLVKLALGRSEDEAPKSVGAARPRREALGPLSAAQVAEKTGMPLSAAKLMVR